MPPTAEGVSALSGLKMERLRLIAACSSPAHLSNLSSLVQRGPGRPIEAGASTKPFCECNCIGLCAVAKILIGRSFGLNGPPYWPMLYPTCG